MSYSSQLLTDSELAVSKLKASIDKVLVNIDGSSDGSVVLSQAMASFKEFFDGLSEPEFKPEEFRTGDTPSSISYNNNLRAIYNDIARFYNELKNLSNLQVKSFNYSQVVINEIKNRANALSSIVLDLNILNNFTRGDVLVAGDDFLNLDKIDVGAGISSTQAEIVSNGSGLSLARSGSNNLTSDPRIKVEVLPLSPQSKGLNNQDVVNTKPTPGNFGRFYEGNYYNFLGLARPEGGRFNIQYIIDPKSVKAVSDTETDTTKGIFLEYGASEEEKAQARLAMFDNNPDTFWECEYVIRLANPLIPDVSESLVINEDVEKPDEDQSFSDPEAPDTASIQVDVNDLNSRAILQDALDLTVDVIITLPQEQNVNFVSINPVVFSKAAFIDVVDIATADEATGVFNTVDGWDSLRFGKSITPELNEYLTDSQLAATLAPNRFNYSGQGIYPFPVRIAKKIKIRLSMANPAAQVYERTYALLKNNVDVTVVTTTTTTKGRLRF